MLLAVLAGHRHQTGLPTFCDKYIPKRFNGIYFDACKSRAVNIWFVQIKFNSFTNDVTNAAVHDGRVAFIICLFFT